jgi:hypothetical protein
MNFAPGFAQQRIVHGGDQRLGRLEGGFHCPAHCGKKLPFIETVAGIKTVIGAPILLMAVLAAQEAADGAPPETGQLGEQMAPASLERGVAAESGAAIVDEAVQIF